MRHQDIELARPARDIAPAARVNAPEHAPSVPFSPANVPETAAPRGIVEDEIEAARAVALAH